MVDKVFLPSDYPNLFWDLKAISGSRIVNLDLDVNKRKIFVFSFDQIGRQYRCYLYVDFVATTYNVSWKKFNHDDSIIFYISFEDLLDVVDDKQKEFLLFHLNLLLDRKITSYAKERFGQE